MTKEQLQARLTELNIPFKKQWGEKRLEALLPQEIAVEQPPNYTDEQIQEIEKEVAGKNVPTFDEMKDKIGLTKDFGGEYKTGSGLIVPAGALSHLRKTVYNYYAEHSGSSSSVFKVDEREHKTFVREYSLSVHGQEYKKLAQQFVDKNNR